MLVGGGSNPLAPANKSKASLKDAFLFLQPHWGMSGFDTWRTVRLIANFQSKFEPRHEFAIG